MKDTAVQNTGTKKVTKKKSALKEWTDSILFAVVVATIIRWLLIEAFMIPTPSMEGSLMTGDYLFVSKMHYGARTSQTPLQVPLTFQTIWGTSIPSYLEWIKLPMYRLPSFSEVKAGDPVVFNYPMENRPVDMKTYYVKRCVATPGMSFEVRNKVVYNDGEILPIPQELQSKYFIKSKEIAPRVFAKYEISESGRTQDGYVMFLTKEKAAALLQETFVTDVKEEEPIPAGVRNNADVFPKSPNFNWNMDNFGALYLPKEGDKMTIDEKVLTLYKDIFLRYEGNENARITDGKLFIDDKEVTEYTFKQGYYMMMGDNRNNSLDSRFWGFVPADHIVGKPVLVWFSMSPEFGVRWERIFKLID